MTVERPPLFEITLLVETDDSEELERLADAVAHVACPVELSGDDHTCAVPWFVTTTELEDPERWRDLLNR